MVQLSRLTGLTALELWTAPTFFAHDIFIVPADDSFHLPPQLGALTALRALSLRHNMNRVRRCPSRRGLSVRIQDDA